MSGTSGTGSAAAARSAAILGPALAASLDQPAVSRRLTKLMGLVRPFSAATSENDGASCVQPTIRGAASPARARKRSSCELIPQPEIMMLLRPVEIDLTGSHSLEGAFHAERADVNMTEDQGDEEHGDDGVQDLRDLHSEDVCDVEREQQQIA